MMCRRRVFHVVGQTRGLGALRRLEGLPTGQHAVTTVMAEAELIRPDARFFEDFA